MCRNCGKIQCRSCLFNEKLVDDLQVYTERSAKMYELAFRKSKGLMKSATGMPGNRTPGLHQNGLIAQGFNRSGTVILDR